MKIINNLCKTVLVLISIMPVLGITGIFPKPTADMYGNPKAFEFISVLYDSKYIMYMMAVTFLLVIIFILTKRTAAAALILLPVSLNIVGFHAYLDTGIFAAGAVMGNILLIINLYLLWINRGVYKALFAARS